MALPPKDIPASELWLKLQETPAPSEVVDFPRKRRDGTPVGQVRLMVLPQEKHDEARIRAFRTIAKREFSAEQLKSNLLEEVQGDATAKELLALACYEVDPIPGTEDDNPRYPRVFPNGEAVGKLTADEINILFTSYVTLQQKYGPYIHDIQTDDELNAWIVRLAEGGSAFPLCSLSFRALVQLTMLLAERSSKLSKILAGLPSDSLSISESDREIFALDTCFSGKPPDTDTDSGSSESNVDMMSVEEAARLAEEMHKRKRSDY